MALTDLHARPARSPRSADLSAPLAVALFMLTLAVPASLAPWDGGPAPEAWRGNSASLATAAADAR